jgi:hypothetical protein
MDTAIFLDLSERAKFRITGADRLRFLNGQITNDLRKASETSAIEACILNAKGKTDAHIFVFASGESFLVDAAADLQETLKVRLERYVIADDVQIEDVTDQFSLFHVLSQQSPALESGRIVSVRRFAEAGWDVWVDAAQHDALLQELSLRWTLCDSDTAEVIRIEQGIPRWGRELTERDYSSRSQSGTTNDRLPKGLLHWPGSDFTNEDVRPDEQATMRTDFGGRYSASARYETCLSFSAGEGSWLDHERRVQRKNRKRNRPRIRETRLQQRRYQSSPQRGRPADWVHPQLRILPRSRTGQFP